MLNFNNGDIFSNGVMDFEYKSIPPDDINNRIILRIRVENIPTMAVIDTGAPYLILAPNVASRIEIDKNLSLDKIPITIRGCKFLGNLFRVEIVLPASIGESQSFEATAFIPEEDQVEKWGDLPTFLGFSSCLDRIRFAIDPGNTKFHFGSLF